MANQIPDDVAKAFFKKVGEQFKLQTHDEIKKNQALPSPSVNFDETGITILWGQQHLFMGCLRIDTKASVHEDLYGTVVVVYNTETGAFPPDAVQMAVDSLKQQIFEDKRRAPKQ